MVRTLMLLVLLISPIVFADGDLAHLQSCLLRASHGHDPAERDDAKVECVQRFNQSISIERCAHVATMMEYTSTADDLRKYCVFSLRADPTFQQCMSIAKASLYGENGDEIRWQCMRLLAPTTSRRNCLRVSTEMILPHNKRRAAEFCNMSY